MKRKTIIHEFDPVIYPLKLWVVRYPTDEAIHERFESVGDEEINSEISTESNAVTYDSAVKLKESGNYGVLIALNRSKININTMAHEATHAARVAWQWLNEDITGSEADAYLVGWIAECIDKAKRPTK